MNTKNFNNMNNGLSNEKEMVPLKYAPTVIETVGENSGYSVNQAIEELIDNSIGAGSSEIHINFDTNTSSKLITIKDNGRGMTKYELEKYYFTVGDSGTHTDGNAPGNFGIGGKGGCISLMGGKTGKVVIKTHHRDEAPLISEMFYYPKVKTEYTRPEVYESFTGYGTIIECPFNAEDGKFTIKDFKDEVKLTYFGRLKKDVKIYVSENNLKEELLIGNDPLYRNLKSPEMEDNMVIKPVTFYPEINGINYTVGIEAAYLFRELSNLNRHGFDKRTVRTSNRSGFYITTAGRLYTKGNNFKETLDRVTHASLNGLRIEMDVEKKAWPLLDITWNKSQHIKKFKGVSIFTVTCRMVDSNGKETYDSILNYIIRIINDFKKGNPNKENSEESYNIKLISDILKSLNCDNIDAKYVEEGGPDDDMITYDNGLFIFNGNAFPNKRNIKIKIKEWIKAFSLLVRKEEYDLINDMVEVFNEK